MATIQIADKNTLDRVETKVDAIRATNTYSEVITIDETFSVDASTKGQHSAYKVAGTGEIAIQRLLSSVVGVARNIIFSIDGKQVRLSPNPYSSSSFIDSGFSYVKFSKSFEILVDITNPKEGANANVDLHAILYMVQ